MAFQSLYRRYRPQRFGDLVGQDPVATALRNTVREDRVGHAYLFSGPRGTGKTTTARILAKAVNCTALGTDGEPCGECENCRAVAAGTFGDLVELDAASNNGVEAIRDLIDRVHLGTGASTRRKVYLVDEVHMLSNAASNALLKTLEEPPGHVVFVLATTNPEKVLPTIRSRTQHFEFSLIPTDVLAGHLAGVLRSEGVEADPEALDALARAAAGSARDALSLLDQALAHEPDHLRAEAVASIFGRTPFERRAAILGAVAGEDAGGALAALQELLDSGHEPRRVAADLLQALRDAFVLVAAEGRVRVDLPDDEREALARLGAELGEGPLVRAVEALGRAVVDMRGVDAADPRLVLEVALLRIAHRRAGPPLQVLAQRVERLEQALGASGQPVPAAPAAPAGPTVPSSVEAPPTGGGGRRRGAGGGAQATPDAAPAGSGRPRAALGELLRERRNDEPEPAPAPGATATATATSDGDDDADDVAVVEGGAADIDDVVVAWADVLGALGPGARSVLQEAQPLRLDGDVVVFGAPPAAIARVKPRLKQEAGAIRAAFAERIGLPPRFRVVAHEGFSAEIDLRNEPPAAPDPVSQLAAADDVGDAPGEAGVDQAAPGPAGTPAATPDAPGEAGAGSASTGPAAPGPAGTPAATPDAPADDDDIDPSELVDAPPAGAATDPTTRLVELFDATVVEEIPRETSRD